MFSILYKFNPNKINDEEIQSIINKCLISNHDSLFLVNEVRTRSINENDVYYFTILEIERLHKISNIR